ncbi:MAG: hypothetical protein H8E29_14095 [Anaerolineales bacterium]|uniref:Uncharacterized protein n=1 Tax=Candidatus Desulfolinea nitratireducens TaxID=2841698 RepID=A0A8J6NMA4_9CHLR|nr:hypothetical protein [Candidatus Desulfolinea nitratireducens]
MSSSESSVEHIETTEFGYFYIVLGFPGPERQDGRYAEKHRLLTCAAPQVQATNWRLF